MVFKMRTSRRTMEIFDTIGRSEQLQPFVLAKLSIALSLKSSKLLAEEDYHRDNNGLELNRQTITGEFDALFKCLIEKQENCHINDDEYFPKYLKAHLDRGAGYLLSEHKYGGDFLTHLLETEKGI